MVQITNYEIIKNDEHICFMLQETKSSEVASILKDIQCLESGEERVKSIKVLKKMLK